MAKTKITALTELTDTNIAIGDLIPIVDISDTSQAASGTTKKVTITSLATAVASAFSGDSPTFVNLNTTGTTTLGDSGDATTVNGTLGVTGAVTGTGKYTNTIAGESFKSVGVTNGATFLSCNNNQTSLFAGINNSTGNASQLPASLASAGILGLDGAFPVQLFTNNAARMTILANGDVGIGETSPAYKLDVNGTLGVTGATTLTGGATTPLIFNKNSSVISGATVTDDGILERSIHQYPASSSVYEIFRIVTVSNNTVVQVEINVKIGARDGTGLRFSGKLELGIGFNSTNPAEINWVVTQFVNAAQGAFSVYRDTTTTNLVKVYFTIGNYGNPESFTNIKIHNGSGKSYTYSFNGLDSTTTAAGTLVAAAATNSTAI